MKRNKLNTAILAALTATATPEAVAQLEEVVVTATRREESAQDIPIAVQVLEQEALQRMGIANFGDYLLQLPDVTAGGSGPGRNTVYIRGLASTTPNALIATGFGLTPNVSFYLDDQPLAQPGRNLDVYAVDLERIEVLSGPQGTLFGASSQAGAVRLITNKPDPAEPYGRVRFGSAAIHGGDLSANSEMMLNFPATDKLTFRAVTFFDRQGGWVDNVEGVRDIRSSARFRPVGTVRDNGVAVTPNRAGFQPSDDFVAPPGVVAPDTVPGNVSLDGAPDGVGGVTGGVTGGVVDNKDFLQDDINDVTYVGGRLSALYEIDEERRVLLSYMQQDTNTDGVFFADPHLGPDKIQRFADDSLSDKFENTSWTYEGRMAELDMVYTGAFTDRSTDQIADYTDYLFVSQYMPHYVCDTGVAYLPNVLIQATAETPAVEGWRLPGSIGRTPTGACYAPNAFLDSETGARTRTHELRFNTDAGLALRGTFGGFYGDMRLTEFNDFTMPGSSKVMNDVDDRGIPNDPGFDEAVLPYQVIVRNDLERTDTQLGLFGELEWDFAPRYVLTAGLRYYNIAIDLEGATTTSLLNKNSLQNPVVTRVDYGAKYDGRGGVPGNFEEDGIVGRLSLSYEVDNDTLLYGGWSEGFRPGLLNPAGGDAVVGDTRDNGRFYGVPFIKGQDFAANCAFTNLVSGRFNLRDDEVVALLNNRPLPDNPSAGASALAATCANVVYTVPFGVETDEVTNYEFGWKADFFNGSMRFNGNFFYVDIQNMQTTVSARFSDNAANAEIFGFKGDLLWQPPVDGLVVVGAFSILDSELTELVVPDAAGEVDTGIELAYSPKHRGNIRARYQWPTGELTAHVMPQLAWSGKSYTDVIRANRIELDNWYLLSVSGGLSAGDWTAEIYIENLTDQAAELSGDFTYEAKRITYAQPRTIGMRFSYDF